MKARWRIPSRPRLRDVALSCLVVGLGATAAVAFRSTTAETARSAFRWLTPTHCVEVVCVLVIVAAATSLPPTDALFTPVVAALRAAGGAVSRLAVASPLVVLTVAMSIVAAVRIALGAAENLPVVLGDELVYVDLAKSFALFGEPLLRGRLDVGQSIIYPLFLSPAYRFAPDGAVAYTVVKAMNAIVMSLTAVPAYYLARRILTTSWSLVAAVLSIAVPWTGYAVLSLTEPLFYPAFTAFALVFVLMLERPSLRRQLLVLVGLAVLVGIRPQALAVVGSVVAAIVVIGLTERALSRTLRVYLPTLAVVGAGLVAGLCASAAGVPVPTSGYSGLFNIHYGVVGVAKWTLWTVETFAVSTGVVALLAFPFALRRLLRRDAPPAERAFGLGALALCVGILASVAALSASPYGLGILHERNLFYVTPLLVISLAYWVANGRERRAPVALGLAVALAAGASLLPDRILRSTNNVDGPTASFVNAFKSVAAGPPVQLWIAVAVALGGAVVLLARRPLLPLASVVVAFAFVAPVTDYQGPLSTTQARRLAWVDHALPANATATLLHVDLTRPNLPCAEVDEYEQQGLLVWTEFLNTRVTRLLHVYDMRGRDNLSAPLLTARSDGVLLEGGQPIAPRFVVVDSRQPIAGTRIARFDLARIGSVFQGGASLTLWKADAPLRLGPVAAPLPPRADGGGC